MSIFKRIFDIVRSEVEEVLDEVELRQAKRTKSSFDPQGEPHATHGSNPFQASDVRSEYSNIELEYFANLEVKPGASFEDIKKAYRRQIQRYHPDRHDADPERREIARKITQQLNDAYEHFKKKARQ